MYKGLDLSNKVAVLTGSTAGMGLAITRRLAQAGQSGCIQQYAGGDKSGRAGARKERP